ATAGRCTAPSSWAQTRNSSCGSRTGRALPCRTPRVQRVDECRSPRCGRGERREGSGQVAAAETAGGGDQQGAVAGRVLAVDVSFNAGRGGGGHRMYPEVMRGGDCALLAQADALGAAAAGADVAIDPHTDVLVARAGIAGLDPDAGP